jgi:hypothetical protein
MEIARYWRLNDQRYSLRGTVCTNCGKPSLSQRPTCDACSGSSADGGPGRKHSIRREAITAAEPAGK